jgi:3D (Asp-Asp-Asp) domain-containing protein
MEITKRYILPIIYGILILRPAFLGGTPWVDYSDARNVLPIVSEAIAADKPIALKNDTMEVWVTAYSSTPEETDATPFTTASNKDVQDGFLAANFLPFGTKVKIPSLFGDKVFTVEDRMHRRKTNFVDVWMPTKKDALKFGIHRTEIEVVHYPPLAENTVNKNPAN